MSLTARCARHSPPKSALGGQHLPFQVTLLCRLCSGVWASVKQGSSSFLFARFGVLLLLSIHFTLPVLFVCLLSFPVRPLHSHTPYCRSDPRLHIHCDFVQALRSGHHLYLIGLRSYYCAAFSFCVPSWLFPPRTYRSRSVPPSVPTLPHLDSTTPTSTTPTDFLSFSIRRCKG